MGSIIPFVVFGVIFVGSLLFFMYLNRESTVEEPTEETNVTDDADQ